MQGAKRRDLLAVALISGASLGYELLLLRFFSIMYWDHFAHLIIGMALLGFGVSGTVLARFQHRLIQKFHRSYYLSALLFACTLLTATSLTGRLGFNPPEVIWDGGQLGRLAAVFILATLPFFCAGLCIGMTMRWKPGSVARIYQADLGGAASGALLIMALLFVLTPQDGVRVLALIGLASAFIVHSGENKGLGRIGLAAAVLLIGFWPARWLTPVISPFKGLSQSLRIPGICITAETHSPSGDFIALTSATIPFRFAPGLSLLAPVTPPEQVAVFHDGHPAGVIHRGSEGPSALDFLRWTPMALPYALLDRPRVLVVGAGGGGDVWHALIEKASHVDAVEPHRELIDFAVNPFGAFSGDIYNRGTVSLYQGDVRGFLAAVTEPYDLIQISPFGTATPPVGGGHALGAQYLYTVEGLQSALSRLSARGLLAITLTFDLPPRSAVKMMATIAESLRRSDHSLDPSHHMAVIRSWNTVTIVASPSLLSPRQLAAVRAFCRSLAFDLDWLPDITAAEVNRINILDRPYVYEAAKEIWQGTPHRQLQSFNLTPATDDRPWFSHFFCWRSFGALWAQRASGAASMLEWEYLLLWMSLAVALCVSLPAIVWPLRLLYRVQCRQRQKPEGFAIRAVYFAALGLAFFFLEIAFIQQFVLFLSHPMIAMAAIVPSFLFFAGCGGGYAQQYAGRAATSRCAWLRDRPVAVATGGIVIVASVYLWLLPLVFRVGAAWPDALRVLVSIMLIGGLAFWMGMPFPLGLKRLGEHQPDVIPFAWGVNGFFSVISAIVATILALHAGFRVVIAAALGLYILAAACERRL
jgi:hypothetical protein